jgi:hypothetical protein
MSGSVSIGLGALSVSWLSISVGDAGHVFDADKAVGHFNVGLVEKVNEEVVVGLRRDEGGCHFTVLIAIFLSVAGLINGCFL